MVWSVMAERRRNSVWIGRGTNLEHTQDLLVMLDVLAHRGPDGSGVFEDNHVALGHVRLSIVDQAGEISRCKARAVVMS